MADAEKNVLYCLKPKKAKKRAVLLKNDNYTVGKNDDCDLRLNSVEIDPLCAKLIKFTNKQGWCIVNYSSSDSASTVRVNRIKLKPNIKKGLKEGDNVSFGYLDGEFEYVYKKYKLPKKKQAIVQGFEATGSVSLTAAAGSNQNTAASSFCTATSSQSVLAPATNTVYQGDANFKFGAEIRLGGTQGTFATPATSTFAPGDSGFQLPRNMPTPESQKVSPLASPFPFGSNFVSSKPAISSSAHVHFGSKATTSTEPSKGSKNTKKLSSSISKIMNDFRAKKAQNQKVIAAKEANTINTMKRRLENYEKTITELQRDKEQLQKQITQSNLKEEKMQSETLCLELQLKTKLIDAEKEIKGLVTNLNKEKTLSQKRLNDIKKLKSELDQYAMKGNKLNCNTCKKFGV